MEQNTVEEGKTAAIVSYLTWVGTLIAFLMNNTKKNPFASFHIRQAFGLSVASLVNTFLITKFTGAYVYGTIGLVLVVFRIIGLIGAFKGEEKLIPLLGDVFQENFKSIQ